MRAGQWLMSVHMAVFCNRWYQATMLVEFIVDMAMVLS